MHSDLSTNQESHTQDLESNMARCVGPSIAINICASWPKCINVSQAACILQCRFQELEAVLAQAEQHLSSAGDGNADDTWQAHWQQKCA